MWWSSWKLPHHLFLFPPPPSTSSPHRHSVEPMANTHFRSSQASWHHHHYLNHNRYCITHLMRPCCVNRLPPRNPPCPSPCWGMWAFMPPATSSPAPQITTTTVGWAYQQGLGISTIGWVYLWWGLYINRGHAYQQQVGVLMAGQAYQQQAGVLMMGQAYWQWGRRIDGGAGVLTVGNAYWWECILTVGNAYWWWGMRIDSGECILTVGNAY